MSVKSVLIIGGTRGIGLEIVKQSLAVYPEAIIFATARDVTKATDLQALASASNNRVKIIVAVANDKESLEAAAKEIKKTTYTLEHVIYNAGVLAGWGNILESDIEGLKTNMETNVYGALYAAVVFSPLLLASKYSKKSLGLISSTYGSLSLAHSQFKEHEISFGLSGYDASAMYNISKTALNRLGKELDGVLSRQGLPVLLIHPGMVLTDMNPIGDIHPPESAAGVLKAINNFVPSEKNYVRYTGLPVEW